MSAAQQTRGRLNMQPPGLNIYASQSRTPRSRSCREQGPSMVLGIARSAAVQVSSASLAHTTSCCTGPRPCRRRAGHPPALRISRGQTGPWFPPRAPFPGQSRPAPGDRASCGCQ